jgi:hypothetical protein
MAPATKNRNHRRHETGAGSDNVRLQIRKATFEPIAAPQNEFFVGCVGFGISKRKQLVGMDFVA